MKKKLIIAAITVASIALTVVLLVLLSKLDSGRQDDIVKKNLYASEENLPQGKDLPATQTPSSVPTEQPLYVASPQNLNAYYYQADGSLSICWDRVDNAISYEITENSNIYETTGCSLTIADVREGMTHTISVRAVAKDKNQKNVYSEYSLLSYKIPLMVQPVSSISPYIHGSYFQIFWNNADGASYYEVSLDGGNTSKAFYQNCTQITGCTPGQTLDISVRSIREKGTHTYYSDWSRRTLTYTAPDSNTDFYEYALDMDLQSLKKWAQNKGYEIKVSTQDGITIADVKDKDDINSSGVKAFERGFTAFADGFTGGASDSIDETLEEDWNDPFSAAYALIEADGIKNYINEKSEEAQNAGLIGGLLSFADNLFVDKNIHYCYYYSDTLDSADLCEMTMLNSEHTDYFKNRYAKCTPTEDGLYYIITPCGNSVAISNGTTTINGIKFNHSYIVPLK